MSREEEYKQKCRQVKDYYLEEICEHEDAGCLGDAENEEDIEARRRREMVERCEKNIEKAVNEGRLDAVLFVGGLDDAKREALEVMRGRGFEIGEEVWREGLFKYRDVYIARW